MSKIILLILIGWFFLKIRKIIKGIKIKFSNRSVFNNTDDRKNNMDIQDGEFEEVK